MRILYLNTLGQLGGAETSLIQLLRVVGGAQPEWKIHLMLGEDGPLAVQATAIHVPTTVLPLPRSVARLGDSAVGRRGFGQRTFMQGIRLVCALWDVKCYVAQLSKQIRALAPDLIHVTGFKMHVLGIWARPHGVPVIWHFHDYLSQRPMMRRLLAWSGSNCAAIISNSNGVSADTRSICSDRVPRFVLYNGLDLVRFSPVGDQMNLDRAAGLDEPPPGTLRIGLIATFARWKGHTTFLKAISLLPRELPVRAYVIGGAIYRTQGSQHSLEELREEAARIGVLDRIAFTGFAPQPDSAIRALDVVVHASTEREPFGMVIVEAMACGKPVIASAGTGAAELFEDPSGMLFHPGGDATALSSQILALAADPALRARLGRIARRSAEAVFQPERLATSLKAIYFTIQQNSVDTHHPAKNV